MCQGDIVGGFNEKAGGGLDGILNLFAENVQGLVGAFMLDERELRSK